MIHGIGTGRQNRALRASRPRSAAGAAPITRGRSSVSLGNGAGWVGQEREREAYANGETTVVLC